MSSKKGGVVMRSNTIRIATVLFFLLVNTLAVYAQEVKFPTFSFEGEELAKVKEWEKTWVGQKVTAANLDQVKDLLLEPL